VGTLLDIIAETNWKLPV